MAQKEIPYLHPETFEQWYSWLNNNSTKETAVRVVLPKKGSSSKGITTDEAVSAALCYGWIDSLAGKYDAESSFLTFTPRNAKSNWSKPNRERAAKLINGGLMKPAGQKMIDLAKATGTWDLLADVEEGLVPPDVAVAFRKNVKARQNFDAFPPSSRKRILTWIVTAKRPETRKKRIAEAVALAENNVKANHPELKNK